LLPPAGSSTTSTAGRWRTTGPNWRPDARYDLILSEPSNPWIAGIGGLFSREYFQTLRDRLEPGGAVAQWTHAYEQDDETLACVLLTFGEVFPHVTVWSMSNADLLLVGTRQSPVWDFARAAEAIERPAVAADLARIGMRGFYTLLSRQLMSSLRVGEANSLGGWLNTDDFPFLEFRAPRAFFLDRQATLHVRFDERNRTLRNTDLALKDYLGDRSPTVRELTDLDDYLEGSGESLPRLHASVAAAWSVDAPADGPAADRALRFGVVGQRAAVEEAARLWRRTPGDSVRTVAYIDLLTETYATLRSAFYDASDLAEQLLEVLPAAADRLVSNRVYYDYLHGQVAFDQGHYDLALASLDRTRQLLGLAADPTALQRALSQVPQQLRKTLVPVTDPRTPPDNVLVYLARTQLEVGLVDQARETFRSAYRVNPRNPVAAFWLVELDDQLGSGRFRPGLGLPPVP
jgi:tetratricopeptide (TPR) repeat protein